MYTFDTFPLGSLSPLYVREPFDTSCLKNWPLCQLWRGGEGYEEGLLYVHIVLNTDVVIVLCSAHVHCVYYALRAHDTDVVSHCEFS